MSRVLVTGAAGFVGSHCANRLHDAGHTVVALDDLSGGFVENMNPDIKFIQGSICDELLVGIIFRQHKPEYVIHLAAFAAEGLSDFVKLHVYSENLLGSCVLLNAAVNHGVKCFVFTSSIAVMGHQKPPFDEDMAAAPADSYGISKLAFELELQIARRRWGLPYVIFRPHNIFGPGQNIGDSYRNVVGIFMNQCMQGKPMTIFGDGSQTRAFSYIDAVAAPIAASIDRTSCWNQIFNIGADTPYHVIELAHKVAEAMGVEPNIEFLPARQEAIEAYSSHARARHYFGDLMVDIGLEKGLAQMAAWAKSVGPRKTKAFKAIEIQRGLPESWRTLT